MFKSNISFAEEQLLSYLPKTGKYYETNRNYSEDRSNNKTTSLLTTLTFNFSELERRDDNPLIDSLSGCDDSISNLSRTSFSRSFAKKV